jgi:selenocysteine lyase/cysteine desulfurase
VKVAREKGVDYVFADGAQVVGMLPVDVRALGVDAYCMSPHKWLQAPKGIGLMYMKKDLQERVRPQTVTWGQKRWNDSRVFEDYGTRDVPALLALGDAIAFHAKAGIEKTAKVRHELWRKVRAKVKADDRIIWRSPGKWELGGSLYAIEVKGKESSRLGEALWKKHKMVVRAFHSDRLNTLRLSPNVANTEAQIDAFFETLVKL